jgi:RNA polymerase sigma-70 factor, ECF subfamily
VSSRSRALHAQAPHAAATDWAGIERLYAALEQMQPSPVVTLNRAVRAARGALGGYFYVHGLRGALLAELGREAEARDAFGRAIALANTPAEAAHIRDRLDQLEGHARAREKS